MMKFNTFVWLAIIALLAGPAFLWIKVAVQDIPPLTLAAVRVSLAAALLYLVFRLQGGQRPKARSFWESAAVIGFFSNTLPFALLNWAGQYTDSTLTAMLIGATPLFTILLAHFFTGDDRLTLNKVIGVWLGFVGLILLLAPALLDGVQSTFLSLSATLGAAASYAAGIVYSRQKVRGLSPLAISVGQLVMAALYLFPLALILERPYAVPFPAWPAIGSLLALVVFSTALGNVLYYRLIEKATATHLSMIAYMVPIVGAVLGVVILQEQLHWNAYLGCIFILLGIMAVNGVFRGYGWRLRRRATVRL
jgi:drug/metabolite transporter (DMT)-like permease